MASLAAATEALVVAAKPVLPGTITDEFRYQFGPDGDMVMWRWDGAAWQGYGMAPKNVTGDPNSTVTALVANQLAVDTSFDVIYYATTEGGTVWNQIF